MTRPKVLYGIGGALLLLVIAELIGRFGLAGRAWPPLTDVLAYLATPAGWSLLWRNGVVTLTAAAQGLLLGVVVAVVGAALALVVPALRPGFDRFAAILNAFPTIALAPLLITTVGRVDTPLVIAALSVGFVMFVTMTSAFSTGSAAHSDVFTVLGASRMQRLRRLELPRAVPAFFDGLTMSAPAAILGATIGEWFGAPRGLGLLLVSAMQNYQMALLWSAALVATVFSLAAYLVLVQLQRLAVGRFA
ncbi:ABC transporter permease subunit [Rathayibacter sp. VKM Ac-2803]|uniref:ABC transporter permease n=1 Tax=unclassified Rathayibacter TaxID=2609250 RepID=UPI001359F856|nr:MULTISPECIES: ABC transporter permease subunit [unclassified Rathayibacter]MWV51267.1 ABC transporter permease subunit [Rathayibacter sp. VKM Ac-2803]MWV57753.1 ABC transporter permease subunit [Rathayibacter sp. VKM Ac-2754]